MPCLRCSDVPPCWHLWRHVGSWLQSQKVNWRGLCPVSTHFPCSSWTRLLTKASCRHSSKRVRCKILMGLRQKDTTFWSSHLEAFIDFQLTDRWITYRQSLSCLVTRTLPTLPWGSQSLSLVGPDLDKAGDPVAGGRYKPHRGKKGTKPNSANLGKWSNCHHVNYYMYCHHSLITSLLERSWGFQVKGSPPCISGDNARGGQPPQGYGVLCWLQAAPHWADRLRKVPGEASASLEQRQR